MLFSVYNLLLNPWVLYLYKGNNVAYHHQHITVHADMLLVDHLIVISIPPFIWLSRKHLAALKAAHAFLREFAGVRSPCASVWSPDCSQPGGGGSSLIESFIHVHCAHIVMCKGEKGRRELRWPVWSFHIVNIPRCVSTKRGLGAQRTSNIFFMVYCTVQAFITHTSTGTCKARNWD